MEAAENEFPDLNGLTLLIVDDDPGIVRSLKRVLVGLGAEVTGVGGVREAWLVLAEHRPDAILADLQLKDGSGLELLPVYQSASPEGVFYVITGHGNVGNAVEALRRGARHYFEKPIDPLELGRQLLMDLGDRKVSGELAQELSPYLIYRDRAMHEALLEVPRFAASSEPVLIQGETGTGKELAARALHGLGPRAQGAFVAVNCGAIPETMLEAELFGHEKGAFTGASRRHRGRFEQADKGTLFLDEVGEMPPAAQVSLLRVLEEGVVQRLGAERPQPVDVRVVAATHRPLQERVEAGLFREDLLFRLDVLPIRLPPLRQRPRDIGLLIQRFLDNSVRDMGWDCPPPAMTPEALALLETHNWPGNVRELRNLAARLAVRLPRCIHEVGPRLLEPLLPPKRGEGAPKQGVFIPKGTTLKDAEWLLIDAALKESGYNRAKAARLLGIGERTLRRKLNES